MHWLLPELFLQKYKIFKVIYRTSNLLKGYLLNKQPPIVQVKGSIVEERSYYFINLGG
jgi:hypothetical protein